jgi:hypothetical protein
MTMTTLTDLTARDTILKLLTDDEVAKVSSAEGTAGLTNGLQYLDLAHLDRGIQTAAILNKFNVGDVIPRNAVSDETWKKITAQLAH